MSTLSLTGVFGTAFPIGRTQGLTTTGYTSSTAMFNASGTIPTGATVSDVTLTYSATIADQFLVAVFEVYDGNGALIYTDSFQGSQSRSHLFTDASLLQNGGFNRMRVRVTARGWGYITGASVSASVTYTSASISEPTVNNTGTRRRETTTTPTVTYTPTPSIDNYAYGFVAVPTNIPAADTNYTLTIDATSGGIRDARLSGTGTLSFYGKGNNETVNALQSFKVGSTTATTHSITFTEGRWTGTIQFPSTIKKGTGYIRIGSSYLNFSPGGKVHVIGGDTAPFRFDTGFDSSGGTASSSTVTLQFTTQPASSPTLGAALTCVVTARTVAGATITGFTSTVSLILRNADGSSIDQTFFKGTKTATAVAGVASFSGLSINAPGRFLITATAPQSEQVNSSVISVSGSTVPSDFHGLRQNLARDGTTWVGTTGYPTVTANPAVSTTEKLILDGDLNINTSSKTVHGIRFVPPYAMYLSRVLVKFAVSSLTGTPYIRILGSNDTTVGTDGTWTELTSFKLESTAISIRQFEFHPAEFYKGYWITLDQGSGSPSMIWYSMQLFGMYNNNPLEILAEDGLDIDAEGVLSIPYPQENINSATTKLRRFILRNNTSSTIYASFNIVPARYNTDTGVNGLVDLLDGDSNPLGPFVVIPAFNSTVLQLRWKSSSAPTLDGEHLVRISVTTGDTATSYAIMYNNAGAGFQVTYLDNTASYSSGTGGRTHRGASTVPGSAFTSSVPLVYPWTMRSIDASATIEILGPYIGVSALQTVTAVADKTQYNRMLALSYTTAWITCDDSLVIYQVADTTSATSTAEATWKTNQTFATLPAQTTGPKTMRHGKTGRVWIANGLTSNIKIYEVNYAGTVLTTIDTATDLSGLTVESHCYDPVNDEVYVITRNSGAGRSIARYTASTGAWVATVTNTDEGAVNCQGMQSIGGYLYVMYNGRYINRYDLQTLANRSRVYDWAIVMVPTNNTSWEGRI